MALLGPACALAAIGCGGAGQAADGGRADVSFDPPEVGLDGGTYVPVPGNCGFDPPAAFCETFELGPMAGGRAGELDPARWSAVRSAGIDTAFGGGIGKAELPQCRPGLTGALVLPDGDTVICDPTATIPTRHLLTATAAQNYGLNTYRIRQPFDFAGRTGTIKLDVDLTQRRAARLAGDRDRRGPVADAQLRFSRARLGPAQRLRDRVHERLVQHAQHRHAGHLSLPRLPGIARARDRAARVVRLRRCRMRWSRRGRSTTSRST